MLTSCINQHTEVSSLTCTYALACIYMSPGLKVSTHSVQPLGGAASIWTRRLKFVNLSPDATQMSIQINTLREPNFMQPFAGLKEGFQFGAVSPPTVSTLPEEELGLWHHYAISWNATDGARSLYVDGEKIQSDTVAGSHAGWLDDQVPDNLRRLFASRQAMRWMHPTVSSIPHPGKIAN